jgi:hypothetical protein
MDNIQNGDSYILLLKWYRIMSQTIQIRQFLDIFFTNSHNYIQ